MRVLFDQGTPLPLKTFLFGHEIKTAFRMGWATLENGDLIRAAEAEFDLLITTDKNWKYQQRITDRRLAIVVLPSANWPVIKEHVEEIVQAVNGAKPGDFIEI